MSFGFHNLIANGYLNKYEVSFCKYSNSLRARDDRNVPMSEASIAALISFYVDGRGVFSLLNIENI